MNIDITDEYVIDMIIDGVTDAYIGRTIRSAKYTEVNELYNYMQTLGSVTNRKVP